MLKHYYAPIKNSSSQGCYRQAAIRAASVESLAVLPLLHFRLHQQGCAPGASWYGLPFGLTGGRRICRADAGHVW